MSKIYTAIVGGKDKERTDIQVFKDFDKFKLPVFNAKIYKVLPHLFLDLKENEWSVWVDGNITLKVDPEELIKMVKTDIGVFPHPDRTCLFDEAAYCMHYGIGNQKEIADQIKQYSKFPKGKGLAMCGILVRKNTLEMRSLCEKWWAEICRGSNRDQISFPYVFNGKVSYFPYQKNIKDNPYFKRYGHEKTFQ